MAALVILSLVIVALLVERHVAARNVDSMIRAHAEERAALVEQATDERRELLTRLQHPDVIVTRAPSADAPAPEPPEDDEWNLVGIVQPLIEVDDVPVEAPA